MATKKTQYNKQARIRARHMVNTVIIDGKEVPAEQEFTQKAWNHLGPRRISGKLYDKQGWKAISNVPDPPEAKEAAHKSSSPPPRQPANLDVKEVEKALKSGDIHGLSVDALRSYMRKKKISVANAAKMPLHELAEEIKKELADKSKDA